MRTGKPLSVDAWKQYQRGLSRWENEGGSGPPSETTNPLALTFNKAGLPHNVPGLPHNVAGATADSRERADAHVLTGS
jgi:hypothetical protein